MSLRKFARSTIAIIVALYIVTAFYIIFDNILIYSSFSRGIEDSFYEINPMRRDFRYDYLGNVIFNLPLFLIFSSWGKNNLRKILVPCIIFGFVFIVYQHLAIAWASPTVSGMQMLKGFFNGAFRYLIFYGSYWLTMRALERIGDWMSENENIL